MKKILFFLVCAALMTIPLFAAEQLSEANASFSCKGKPIHPFLIKEFSNLLADYRPPMITTVDVSAAFDSNKYQQSTVQEKDDWIFSENEEEDKGFTNYESFQYRWRGKMADGTHVLETAENGGGSGFFMDLMFIRFSEGEIMLDGKKEKQLLMSIVGIYSLGDRYDGKIEVLPDKVLIHASPNQFGGGSIDKDKEVRLAV
jgi:hypothetical protein